MQGVGAGECVGLALAELGEGLFDEIVEGQVQRETQHGEVEFGGQGPSGYPVVTKSSCGLTQSRTSGTSITLTAETARSRPPSPARIAVRSRQRRLSNSRSGMTCRRNGNSCGSSSAALARSTMRTRYPNGAFFRRGYERPSRSEGVPRGCWTGFVGVVPCVGGNPPSPPGVEGLSCRAGPRDSVEIPVAARGIVSSIRPESDPVVIGRNAGRPVRR